MAEAGAELLLRLELKGRKKSHRLTAASDLRNHLVPFFGAKELARITPDDIERYVRVKRDQVALKTIRNHLNLAHSIFELGLRKNWCLTNPVKRADRPVLRATETRIKFLDQRELEQLLASDFPPDAFGKVERVLYLTAAMTGLRQGELLGLRWRDVDFPARRVRIVSPYVRGEFGDPKSTGSARSVPLAQRVSDELRLWRWGRSTTTTTTSCSRTRKPARRWTAPSSFGASSKPSSAPVCAASPSTSSATPSVPGWPPRASPCAPSSTGWDTPTARRRRSTRTTSRPAARPTW
jgi:integrase